MNPRFSLVIIAALLLSSAAQVTAQREAPPVVSTPAARDTFEKEQKKQRIREGKTFTRQLCSFQAVGPRVAIRFEDSTNPTDSKRYLCLENLQLERVLQAIQDNSTQMYWWIDGTFTEYRGSNYVLVQRIQQAPQSAVTSTQPSRTNALVTSPTTATPSPPPRTNTSAP